MEKAFKIEKGVPVPRVRGYTKYPFGEMEIGDSFVSDHPKVRSAASYYGRRHNKKFTIRLEKDTGLWRIWRVE